MHRSIIFFSLMIIISQTANAQLQIEKIKVWENDIKEGDYVSFTAYVDFSDDLTFVWDFGDGITKESYNNYSIGHIYQDDKDYTVSLTVKNEQGDEASKSVQVSVSNVPPKIFYAYGKEVENIDKTVFFECVAYDPGNDSHKVIWDFGDGNTEENNNLFTTTHQYSEKGFYQVTLTVDDQDGGIDSYTFIVIVDQDWGAKITGAIRDSLSGGTGMFYFHEIEKGICHKVITLYDDASQSILSFVEKNKKGITNRTINITSDNSSGMNAAFSYEIISGLYGAAKITSTIWDQTTNQALLQESLSQVSPLELMRGIEENGEEEDFSQDFVSIGGTLETGPLEGNTIKGEFIVLMQEKLPHNSQQQPKLIDLNGTFEINVNVLSLNQLHNGCEGVIDEFSLINYTPQDNQKNIHPEYPCIDLEFSENIDISSINDGNVQLGFMHENGNFVKIPIQFEAIDENKVKVIPQAPLFNAVIYEMKILGGVMGIKSEEGGLLSQDYNWKFETLIKPIDQWIRVYQTIADAPLVEGKNAMVRAIATWAKPSGVAESSFVKSFPAKVTLKNSQGDAIAEVMPSAIFKHQNYVSEEQTRSANNSVNIYGWKPSKDDGEFISVVIQPYYQECVPQEERKKYKLNHPIKHWQLKPSFKIDYHFANVDAWHEMVPEELLSMGHLVMEKTERFSEQVFPIKSSVSRYRGVLNLTGVESGSETNPDAFRPIITGDSLNRLINDIYPSLSSNTNADVIVIFHPEIQNISAGGNLTPRYSPDGENCIYSLGPRIVRMKLAASTVPRAAIEHEIGHSFGLEHLPYVANSAERIATAAMPLSTWEDEENESHGHINGFRLYSSSGNGSNKNCTEGNAETPNMINFMFPHLGQVLRNDVFITDKQYDKVMDHFDCTDQYGFSSVLPSSNYTGSLAHANEIFPGWINLFSKKEFINVIIQFLPNGKARITGLYKVELPENLPQTTGNYSLIGFDAQSKKISNVKFSELKSLPSCYGEKNNHSNTVSVITPFSTSLKKLIVTLNDQVLDTYQISEHSPNIKFTNVENSQLLLDKGQIIKWEAKDDDGDNLSFVISYSQNGIDDWQTLGITDKSQFQISPNDLIPGIAPTLKIEANDGFNINSDRVAIKLKSNLKLKSYGPKSIQDLKDGISIQFATPLIPKTIVSGNHLHLVDKKNSGIIPCIITYDEESLTAELKPLESLANDKQYIVFLSKLSLVVIKTKSGKNEYEVGTVPLKDIFGNELEKDFKWEIKSSKI